MLASWSGADSCRCPTGMAAQHKYFRRHYRGRLLLGWLASIVIHSYAPVCVQVVLTNVPEQHSSTVRGATLPGRPESEPYPLPFSRVVYIEATDFRLQDSKDYYGLAPGKSAMLR
eukprot:GHRR01020487.1.p1 GENE.GHRR01020487.1~~GHRR01020487.1.p1  ORF type:complete len:115 (-),score=24.15 GHRR01020487.1:112-456(-)